MQAPTPPPPRPSLRAVLQAISERHRPQSEAPAGRWIERVSGRLFLQSMRYAIVFARIGEVSWPLLVRFRWLALATTAAAAWAARHFHWLGR